MAALARAYTDFATGSPALYDAMFSLDNGLPFAAEATPAPLHEAFQALLDPPVAHAGPDEEPGLFVETFWAALHGLITLTRAGRLPADRIPAVSHSWSTASLAPRSSPPCSSPWGLLHEFLADLGSHLFTPARTVDEVRRLLDRADGCTRSRPLRRCDGPGVRLPPAQERCRGRSPALRRLERSLSRLRLGRRPALDCRLWTCSPTSTANSKPTCGSTSTGSKSAALQAH